MQLIIFIEESIIIIKKIINDEVLISGPKYNITGYPRFNSPIELSDSIVKAGFNVILKATNHVNDKNEEARLADLNQVPEHRAYC